MPEPTPGEAPTKPEPVVPFLRQIFCDLTNPARGIIVSGAQMDIGSLELTIDGNTVLVNRKMFAAAIAAYAK